MVRLSNVNFCMWKFLLSYKLHFKWSSVHGKYSLYISWFVGLTMHSIRLHDFVNFTTVYLLLHYFTSRWHVILRTMHSSALHWTTAHSTALSFSSVHYTKLQRITLDCTSLLHCKDFWAYFLKEWLRRLLKNIISVNISQ